MWDEAVTSWHSGAFYCNTSLDLDAESAVLHTLDWQALYKLSSDSRGVVRGCTEEMCETSCPAVDITGACEVMLAAAFAVSVALAGAQPTAWA
jgi:hypothetical protein